MESVDIYKMTNIKSYHWTIFMNNKENSMQQLPNQPKHNEAKGKWSDGTTSDRVEKNEDFLRISTKRKIHNNEDFSF